MKKKRPKWIKAMYSHASATKRMQARILSPVAYRAGYAACLKAKRRTTKKIRKVRKR